MQSLAARINSFVPPSPPKSSRTRRAATPRLAWPHPETYIANPQTLADAGFCYLPSTDDPDNVGCFICDKQLNSWEPEDDPYEIHANKCPTCPWVMVKCQLILEKRQTGGSATPSNPVHPPNSSVMDKARLETFGRGTARWWPHDQVKHHGAMSKNMAKAGFVYTPSEEPEDDTATCFYCGTLLNGWEFGDDPMEEHSRRKAALTCSFVLSTKSAPSNRKAAKAAETVRQTTTEPEEPDTQKAPAAKGKRRRKKTEALVEQIEQVEPEPIQIKRSTRSRSRATTVRKEPTPAPDEPEEQIAPAATVKPSTPKSKRKKKKPDPPIEPEPREDRPRSPSPQPPQTMDEDGPVGLVRQTTTEPEEPDTQKTPVAKSKRRRKKTEAPVEQIEQGPEPEPIQIKRSTRSRSRATTVRKEPTPAPDEPEEQIAPAATVKPSTPKSKRKKKKPDPPIEPEPQEDRRRSPSPQPPQTMDADEPVDLESFFPGLSIPRPLMDGRKVDIPILTATERAMTVEEWIRAEMERQFEQLRLDGERAIEKFELEAQEVRRRISAL